ncbi:MAG: hypothetical protein Q4D52_06465, partial [Eubacteriales bacterium]|nr:hypothetical protein [Eubacteriales bacterium]
MQYIQPHYKTPSHTDFAVTKLHLRSSAVHPPVQVQVPELVQVPEWVPVLVLTVSQRPVSMCSPLPAALPVSLLR